MARNDEMNGLPSWSLPLIVVALVVPIIVGLVLLGPQGMFLGAILVGVALIVIAARVGRRGRRIEVAAGENGRHHVLIAANDAIDSPRLAERIAGHVTRGREESQPTADVLVISPALNPLLDHWAADVADARAGAKARLETSLDRLSWAGLEARGTIGDSNPILAVEDALREFPADEVIVVAGESRDGDFVGELRRRLDRPVEVLPAGGRQR
jgi:hypothetical protein